MLDGKSKRAGENHETPARSFVSNSLRDPLLGAIVVEHQGPCSIPVETDPGAFGF